MVNEVSRLIRSGVDLNKRSRSTGFFRFLFPAYTPLATAVLWEHTDIVNMLLDAGAGPNVQQDAYRSFGFIKREPLAFAIKKNKYDIAEILVTVTDLSLTDECANAVL